MIPKRSIILSGPEIEKLCFSFKYFVSGGKKTRPARIMTSPMPKLVKRDMNPENRKPILKNQTIMPPRVR